MQQFVHLHNHSDFSLLDGAASVGDMVKRAKELAMPGLALTDHGNLFGAIDFYKACREAGINPIVGSEFYVAGAGRAEKTGTEGGNKYYHLVVLAENEIGYRNLLKLSSISYTEGFYYKPRIDKEILAKYSQGLIASTACIGGEVPNLIIKNKFAEAQASAGFFAELFGPEHFYLELQDHGMPDQRVANKGLIEIAKNLHLPLIATNDMHYLNKGDDEAHEILLCIGTGKKISEQQRMRFYNDQFYMKSPEEMIAIFRERPDAIDNTIKINEMAKLDIKFPGPLLPDYEFPKEFKDANEYLYHLTFEGLKYRYGDYDEAKKERAHFELKVITSMGFTGYFLIVWDFIKWAKDHDIPVGPGRGSGAGSIVAYALRITDIDPLKYNLLFERFLNPDRVSMPDFDIDFCNERREEVINYVTQKYGSDRVAQIATFGTLKAKAVLKDVARALDIPFDKANEISNLIPFDPKATLQSSIEREPKLKAMEADEQYTQLFRVARKLEGKNRHSGLHAAGIVIGKTAVSDYVPLLKDTKTNTVATQYTMNNLEECGLVKMDFLGLKTLDVIKNTLDLLRKRGINIVEDKIPEDDQKTFAMLSRGQSKSIFQFESSGMQDILRRSKPNCVEDLIALNALYRPGPMDYIPQYIDSKSGKKKIEYPDPCLEEILKETYGVIVYQEQVMQVAQKIGGYTLGQADILRRAMGKKKADVMEKEKIRFREGAVKNGFAAEKADKIFDILIPFAGYGFNKSHAAAYSVLAYRTAYLKANYPAEFMAANLSNNISNTDELALCIEEARGMNLEVLPPNVNDATALFNVVNGKIVYGFLGIKGIGSKLADEIVSDRAKNGNFKSFIDFVERLSPFLNKKSMESLIFTGCFDIFKMARAQLMLNLENALNYASKKYEEEKNGQASLFDGTGETEIVPFHFETMAEYPRDEMLRSEKELLGFYFSGHPMDDYKKLWERSADLDLSKLASAAVGRSYTVIGILKEYRSIITKTGKKMAFIKVNDYRGNIELVVFADQLEKYEAAFVVDTVIFLKVKLEKPRYKQEADSGKQSFVVEEVLQEAMLKEKSLREVHISISPTLESEQDLDELRDLLYDSTGTCTVYFHIVDGTTEVVVQAGVRLHCRADSEVIQNLRMTKNVVDAWAV